MIITNVFHAFLGEILIGPFALKYSKEKCLHIRRTRFPVGVGKMGEVVFKSPIVTIFCRYKNLAFAKQRNCISKFFDSKGNPPANIVRVLSAHNSIRFASQIFCYF